MPTNTARYEDVRIMYGNLLDKIVTIDKKRRIIPEGTNIECDRCDKIDNGRCVKRGSIRNGR